MAGDAWDRWLEDETMTIDKQSKRAARELAAREGISYTAARRRLSEPQGDQADQADSLTGDVERTDPRTVLFDWFDDTAGSLDDLVDELVAAYENEEGDERPWTAQYCEDLAETAVETVRRYLRNQEANPDRTDPRQAMTEWFALADAYQETPQPFTMLWAAFHADPWGLTSEEMAQIALRAVQRYLRDSAAKLDRGQP